ncbi:MAG: HIT family protein [Nanoarchaeota archaeon]|nr:HIT family protein [Nanoarchaeota archaeon]MBU1631928.1 HIT family protein [Nanoarchaeota archaeon]MBU1876411.1 HIT family protein [Nanoarchaeota archaeon]
MQLTPEIKAQLEEQKKQCVFCKIISKELNGKIVFEDDKTIALLDIYPALKGHTVFMLKEHYPMPAYVSGEEFKHKFGLIPALSKAVKEGMVMTGMNVFIAIGGAAGQQSYHFLVHLLPRENGDGFFNFLFDKNKKKLDEDGVKILQQNMPIMMKNHFGRHPANWHAGEGTVPSFLTSIYESSTVIYEDEKVLCVIPEKSLAKGHLVISSKDEEKFIENLSQEDSAHLFFTASFASTAVFEGLKAHATNIILKSGDSDDNPDGRLAVHIIPRWQDDGLDLLWKPKQSSYNLDEVASKIKDKTWKIKYQKEVKEIKKENIFVKPEVIRIGGKRNSVEDEIKRAIDKLRE